MDALQKETPEVPPLLLVADSTLLEPLLETNGIPDVILDERVKHAQAPIARRLGRDRS